MKKILAFSIVALLGCLALLPLTIPAALQANITTLGKPGNSGRPMADTTTNSRTDSLLLNRGLLDSSAGTSYSVLSQTSTPLNITFVAGIDWSHNGYPGPYVINIINKTAAVGVAYVNTTLTAINTGTPAGTIIPSSGGVQLEVGNLDGLALHIQGLSAAITVNLSVSTR